jgi:hypothetical protein
VFAGTGKNGVPEEKRYSEVGDVKYRPSMLLCQWIKFFAEDGAFFRSYGLVYLCRALFKVFPNGNGKTKESETLSSPGVELYDPVLSAV